VDQFLPCSLTWPRQAPLVAAASVARRVYAVDLVGFFSVLWESIALRLDRREHIWVYGSSPV
jgi:hypothetical protein